MDKNKPQPKKEVAIDHIFEYLSEIYFFGSEDAAQDFRSFGKIEKLKDKDDWYLIQVDKRYDFQEVVNYIQNYS